MLFLIQLIYEITQIILNKFKKGFALNNMKIKKTIPTLKNLTIIIIIN